MSATTDEMDHLIRGRQDAPVQGELDPRLVRGDDVIGAEAGAIAHRRDERPGPRDRPEPRQGGHDAEPLSDRVRVVRRGAYVIALNFSDQTVPTPAPKETQFVLGSRQLAPAGVAVWKA